MPIVPRLRPGVLDEMVRTGDVSIATRGVFPLFAEAYNARYLSVNRSGRVRVNGDAPQVRVHGGNQEPDGWEAFVRQHPTAEFYSSFQTPAYAEELAPYSPPSSPAYSPSSPAYLPSSPAFMPIMELSTPAQQQAATQRLQELMARARDPRLSSTAKKQTIADIAAMHAAIYPSLPPTILWD